MEEEGGDCRRLDRAGSVKDRLAMLEARADQSMVAVPTLREVREYGKR